MSTLDNYAGGNARIIAGPGTGKTTWIVGRLRELLSHHGVDPRQVVVLTFSVATAHDLRKRLVEASLPDNVHVSTLHSYCVQQLRRHTHDVFIGPTTLDKWEQRNLLCEDLGRRLSMTGAKVSRWLDAYDAAWRTLGNPPADAATANFEVHLEKLRDVFGFALLGESVYKFKKFMDGDPHFDPGVSYLLVYEYQDLNPCDMAVIREIFRRSGADIAVVGDDDQCIYGFRHADPEGLKRFEDEYPDVSPFEKLTSYRCPSNILEPAKRLIARNSNRLPKTLESNNEGGTLQVIACKSAHQQAKIVPHIIQGELTQQPDISYGDILLLVPSPKVVGRYIEALKEAGIPCVNRAADDTSLEDSQVRKTLYLLRLAHDEEDQVAMRGWLYFAPGVGPGVIEKIIRLAQEHRSSFVQAARQAEMAPVRHALSTLDQELARVRQPGGVKSLLAEVEEEADVSDEVRMALESTAANIDGELEGSGLPEDDEGAPAPEQAEQAVADQASDDQVRILTYRKAKGLDEAIVIVTDMEEPLIPGNEVVAEQRRLAYVAFTRAQHSLYVTHVAAPRHSGSERYAGTGATNPGGYRPRSRFLDEAGVRSNRADDLWSL